jgi:molybdopterin converting factor small subunit
MSIVVELFGIPRQRAGTARADIQGATLGEVLLELTRRYPRLADDCFDAAGLRRGYLANLNGQRFVSDPATRLAAGDSLLILSADAGG